MTDNLARKVIKILCYLENQDTFISPLLPGLAVLGGKPPDKESLIRCLQAFPHIFKLETAAKSETKISLQIHVKICKLHQTGQCHSDTYCDGLHICPAFLLSGVCSKQDPKTCPQVHQIHTPHNLKLLQTYLMDKLSKDDIRSMFKHARNRTRSMLPHMCSSYMKPAGCPNKTCPKLHLCQKLLLSNCDAGCTKNHHNVDQRAKNILKMYGVDTTKSSKEIIKALITMNQSSPDDEQKNEDGKEQQQKDTGKKEQPGPSLNTSGHPYGNQTPPSQCPLPARCGPPQEPLQGHPQADQWNYGNASAWQQQQQWNQQASPPPGYGHFQQGHTPLFQVNVNISPPSSQQQLNLYQQQQQQYHFQQQHQSNNPSSASQNNPPESPDRLESQGQQHVRDKSGICMHDFRKCYLGENCSHHHKKMIYQWQMRLTEEKQKGQTWSDFDHEINLQLETAYCDPKEETCLIAYSKGDIVTVNFEDMTGSSKRTKMVVRRLSTPSSEAPNLRPTFYRWSNAWSWFWQDENGTWNEYGDKDKQTFTCDKTSEAIEQAYLANPSGSMDLNTRRFAYRLIFDQMIQMNVSTSTQRPVRRRPKFFTKDDLKTRASPYLNVGSVSCPASWSTGRNKNQEELAMHYAEVKLEETSREYQEVSGLLYETLPRDKKIHFVERIENGELQREKMKRKAGKSCTVAERSLFHGTTQDKMEAICRQGFDFRFSGFRVGAIHGKGSYFAKEAKYSDNYAEKSEVAKKMFVARVLVGE